MAYRRAFVFVEGDDDERFVDKVVRPRLESMFEWVKVIQYAVESSKRMRSWVGSIRKIPDAVYWVLADLDLSPCATERKAKLTAKYPYFAAERVVVVKREIEGWYLAGLPTEEARRLKMLWSGDVEEITKEQFEALWAKQFTSRIDCQVEILKCFDLEIAQGRSGSFAYLLRRCGVDRLEEEGGSIPGVSVTD
jgi:hypothetical protein